MAADTVTPFDRGLQPQRKPFRAEERAKRRHTHFILRIGRAKTSEMKLDAAVDYFRAAAADHRVDPAQISTQTDHLVQALVVAADKLGQTVRRTR